MNLRKTTTNTYKHLHTPVCTSSAITVTMLVVLVMSAVCFAGCSKQNNDPDYISQLGSVSPEFEQKYLLPEDKEYKDKDLKAMIWDSKDLITTGTYQNATSFRTKATEIEYSGIEIPEWFLKHGFTCGALTALAGKDLAPVGIPHVYRKGNTLIHVFRYWAPTLKNDDKLYGAHVSRIAIIQYKNVTQTFYPCQGKYITSPGITSPIPIIKHQDGHVTIDHTIANRFWKARQEAEEGK